MAKKFTLQEIEDFLKSNFQFRRNVVKNIVECCNIIDGAPQNDWRPANENKLWRFLGLNGYNYSTNKINALLNSDFVQEYDPFKDYFESLPEWDGTQSICNFLKYVKLANETPDERARFERMVTKWLVRTIRCALTGKMNKQVLMFLGSQNLGKTAFFRYLVPETLSDYWCENPNPKEKDSKISLSENLIINFDEVDSMGKLDMATVKTYISAEKVKERIPYDRNKTSMIRRSSFVGSTNKNEFLYDETGNKRWLCFVVSKIIFDKNDPNKPNYRHINIDDVWAEAYAYYKEEGYQMELTEEEERQNDEINKQFMVRTTAMDALICHYRKPMDGEDAQFMQPSKIAQKLNAKMGLNIKDETMGRALTFYGFEKTSKKIYGTTIYGYLVVEIFNAEEE